MKILTYDSETTMFKHKAECKPSERIGSAFCKPNRLVMHQLKWYNKPAVCLTPDKIDKVRGDIHKAKLVVGYNIKFDLHWLRREGVDISNISVWDCQLAEWMLNRQNIRGQNSLKDACERRGLPTKLDIIEEEYWSKGVDTDEIPWDVLAEYGINDVNITEELFKAQWYDFKGVYL